ncbi:MAG: hypothetical protein O3A51_10245, partial [Verrucomicrobia bacterium]|nr:hypothetical protein [Verrucomicrobiota bacterium]
MHGVEIGSTTIDVHIVHVDMTSTTDCEVAVTVVEGYDIEVTKEASAESVQPGGALDYKLTLINHGGNNADDFSLYDSPPPTNCYWITNIVTTHGGCAIREDFGGSLVCSNLSLTVGETGCIWISGIALKETILTNHVSLSVQLDTNSVNNGAEVETPVTTNVTESSADVFVTKDDSEDPAAITDTFTYTITVGNLGPAAATDVTLIDWLPAYEGILGPIRLAIESATPGPPVCSIAGDIMTCSFGTVPPGWSTQILMTVTSPASPQLVSNVVFVSAGNDANPTNNTDVEITTVLEPLDLSVAKTADYTVLPTGSNIVYTVVVSNSGPATAIDVVMIDDFPDNALLGAFNPGPPQCIFTNGTMVCTFPTIGPGNSETMSFEFDPQGFPAQLINEATVTSDNPDSNPENNASTVETLVGDKVDLVVAKIADPDPVGVNTTLTYVVQVQNNGPGTARNVIIEDSLPLNVTVIDTDPPGCTVDTFNIVSCSIGDLPNGASTQIVITVTTPGTSMILTNTAFAVAEDSPHEADNGTFADNTTAITNRVVDVADVEITVTMPAGYAVITNGQLEVQSDVENRGPGVARDVKIRIQLPPGTSPAGGAISAIGILDIPCIQDGDEIVCDVGDIPAGGDASRSTTITAPSVPGAIVVTGRVVTVSHDPNLENNIDSREVSVRAGSDLVISKQYIEFLPFTNLGIPRPIVPTNHLFSYVVTVSNKGPSTATAPVLTDQLPPGMQFLGALADATPLTCTTNGSGLVSCPLDPIDPLAAVHVIVRVRSPEELTRLTNVAAITSFTLDPTPGDNLVTNTEVEVKLPADVAVTKSASSNVVATTEFTYTITVTNQGPGIAEDVLVGDYLPPDVELVALPPECLTDQDHPEYPGEPIDVVCLLGDMPPGASTQMTLRVKAPDNPGAVTNEVYVDALQSPKYFYDNSDGDDGYTLVTPILPCEADLTITKRTLQEATVVDASLMYIVTVSNKGPCEAQNVVVTDLIPLDAEFRKEITRHGCVLDDKDPPEHDILTCTFASLASGESKEIRFSVVPQAVGGLSNCVSVTSNTLDPNTADNDNCATNIVFGAGTPGIPEIAADLAVLKLDDPDPVRPRQRLDYEIIVRNLGPSTADVVLQDEFPPEIFFPGEIINWPALGAIHNCIQHPTLAGAMLCDLGPIPANGSVTVNVAVAISTNYCDRPFA